MISNLQDMPIFEFEIFEGIPLRASGTKIELRRLRKEAKVYQV